MPSWEVLYKATADFTALTTAAAKAREELKALQESAKQEGQTERDAAIQSAAAHDTDTAAINRQRDALIKLAAAAKASSEAQHGGNTSAQGHLSDLARETDYQRLLNIQRQRGFTSPQQDYSYRQQELTQQRLWNLATQGGYVNRGDYLQSMQQETALRRADNAEWARRAVILGQGADAAKAVSAAHQEASSSVADLATTYGAKLDLSAYDTATQKVAALKAEIKSLGDELRNANSGLSSQEFTARLKDLQTAVTTLGRDQSKGGTAVGGTQVSGLSKIKADLQELGSEGSRAFGDLEAKGTKTSMTLEQNFKRLTGSVGDVWRSISATASAEADKASGFWGKAAAGIKGALEGLASGGGGGWGKVFESLAGTAGSSVEAFFTSFAALILGVIQLLPELTAGFAAVGAALAALPGLVVAGASAFAIYLGAIQPVIQALSAYMKLLDAQQQAQANPQQTQMQQAQQAHAVSDAYFQVQQAAFQSAQTQLTGAHAVADAQFALTQAVVQGANQEVNAAHQVAESQFNLKQAYFSAAMQQVQSAMQVQSANHSLQDSQFAVTQAQYQLNIAWQQARFQLQELELQVSSASLNLRGGQLALEQAQQNYAQVMAQSTSTALERAQAAYQIQQAEEALKQIQLQNSQNETQLANVRKYGAQQVFGVTQAQHALTDAQFAQVQAQKQLIVVQREAANAQIVAAHQISDAIFALQQAYFSQGQTSVQVAHNIADAHFALGQAITQQGEGAVTSYHNQKDAAFALQQALLQQKLGIPEIASAQQQLNTALSQLGPYAAQAVGYLEKLYYWVNNNTQAQDAFFKAADPALRKIPSIIDELSQFLNRISAAAGGVAAKFVDWLVKLANSPAWSRLSKSTADIITQIGSGILTLVQAITQFAADPAVIKFVDWLVKGFASIATSFANWLASAEKSGALSRFLQGTEGVLRSIGALAKGILTFFADLMGTTTGQRLSNMQAFANLLTQIANQILPNLAIVLRQLSQPALRDALINLLVAVTKLLATIVQTPAFAVVIRAILDGLAAALNAVSALAKNQAVGDVLGTILGAFTALGVLKFTHILDLLGLLFKLPGLRQGLDWLKGIFGKLGFDIGGGGAATGLDTSAAALKGAAADLADAAAALKGAAGGETAAGGAAGGAEGAVSGAAAGTETAGGLTIGSLIAGGLRAGGALAIADFVAHFATNLLPNASQQYRQQAQQQAQGGAFGIPAGPAQWLDEKIYGPKIINFVAFWDQHVKDPVDNWLTKTLPSALTDQSFKRYWDAANNWFVQDVQSPVGDFFSKLLPDWLGGAGQGWSGLFTNIQNVWTNDILGSIGHFFVNLLPDWLGGAGQGWTGLWHNIQNVWTNDIWQPLDKFFTQQIPSWLGDLKTGFQNLWSDSWTWFHDHLLTPVGNWFSKTLPSSIDSAFKSSINWVITNVINKAIGFINDVTGIVGIPKIKAVQTLATGGPVGVMVSPADITRASENSNHSVPHMAGGGAFRPMAFPGSVPGAGDHDSQPIMAMPGEWMIRKPARMAIDRHFGPGFLPQLNQADRILGYASGGEIATYASQFAHRVPYVWGGTTPSGWDCSGFTDYVYHHFGYNPPRTSQEQWQWVRKTRVPETGGLAFMAGSDGTQSSPGHVGIVISPDLMVDAYDTQSGTTFNSIYGSSGAVTGFGIPPTGGGLFGDLLGLGKTLLSDLGNAAKRVAGFIQGGVVEPIFNTVWDHAVQPLVNKVLPSSLSGSGAVVDYAMQSIKKGIDNKLSGIDAANAKAMTGVGGGGPNVKLGQQMAQSYHPGWGSGAEWAALDALWNRESGWNNYAENPSSDAFGIPQALPYTKMPKAAWPVSAGGRADPTAQILWGLQYIAGRYGDPQAAWGHEQAVGWYAGGGGVGPYVGLGGHGGRPPRRPSWPLAWGEVTTDWAAAQDAYFSLVNYQGHGLRRRDRKQWDRVQDELSKLSSGYQNWAGAFRTMRSVAGTPGSITMGEWTDLESQTAAMQERLHDYRDDLVGAEPSRYRTARDAWAAYASAIEAAQDFWNKSSGPGSFPGHPGPRPVPKVTTSNLTLPDVMAMITGGPGAASYATGGPIGMLGFPSMPMPAVASVPALPRATGGDIPPQRQLSDAAKSSGSQPLFRDIHITNPVPEPAGASITRNVTRLAFLAGRAGPF